MRHHLGLSVIPLLGSLLLLGCPVHYSWESFTDASQPTRTDATVAEEVSSDAMVNVPAPEPEELWSRALETGMSAAVLAQHALSAQDWELVASRWERAMATLDAIPETAANYATAQAKIEEYRQNHQVAQRHQQRLGSPLASPNPAVATSPSPPAATAPRTATPPPPGPAVATPGIAPPLATSVPTAATPSAPAVATLCQGIQANPAQGALVFSRPQFYRSPHNPFSFGDGRIGGGGGEDYLIGCLTNNGRQPIHQVEIAYTTQRGGGRGFSSGSLKFAGDRIPPGATVPVRSPFSMNEDVATLVITKLVSYDDRYDTLDVVEPQQSVAYTPSPPVAAPTAHLCQTVQPTATHAPFAVSQVQFYQPPLDPYAFEADPRLYLVGCLTNQSNQPLQNLRMGYVTSEGTMGGATIRIPEPSIAPGQTVPFRKYGDLRATVTQVQIADIQSNQGSVPLNLTVTR